MMVDTLTIARELKAADLPDGQAEAIAAAIGRSVSEGSATKVDLDLAKRELKTDINGGRHELKTDIDGVRHELDSFRHELKADIERARNQLLLWFVSTQIALSGLIVALIKL